VTFLSPIFINIVIEYMNELKLIKSCQEWDLDSFSELYDIYIDKIYKFIYLKTSDKQVAEDITSEVFYKCLNSIDKFDLEKENTSFKTWIYTIANNKVIDFYRTQKKSVDIDEIFDIWVDENQLNKIDSKDKIHEIKEFLSTLKPDHSEVVLLRIWEDLSYKEISAITGKTLDNCKKIVSRTLKDINAKFVFVLLFLIIL